jgi:hypothetical protein
MVKNAVSVFEAATPVPVVNTCVDDFVATIAFSLVLVIDLTIIFAATFHTDFVHITVFAYAARKLFLGRGISTCHCVVIFFIPVSFLVDMPIFERF